MPVCVHQVVTSCGRTHTVLRVSCTSVNLAEEGRELKCARGEGGQGPRRLLGVGAQLGGQWSPVAKPLPARGRNDLAPEDLLGGGGCTLCLACEILQCWRLVGHPRGFQVSRMGKGPRAPARKGGGWQETPSHESRATGGTSVLEPGVSSRSAWPRLPPAPVAAAVGPSPSPGWTFTSTPPPSNLNAPAQSQLRSGLRFH